MSRKEATLVALAVDWGDYPKLRRIFEHRPPQNVYWLELVALMHETIAKGLLQEADRGNVGGGK